LVRRTRTRQLRTLGAESTPDDSAVLKQGRRVALTCTSMACARGTRSGQPTIAFYDCEQGDTRHLRKVKKVATLQPELEDSNFWLAHEGCSAQARRKACASSTFEPPRPKERHQQVWGMLFWTPQEDKASAPWRLALVKR
jgi:hypothetical protein